MADKETKVTLVDVPDPGKLEEHGVSIDAPTPTQFVMPDPWAPSSNGPVTQPRPATVPKPDVSTQADD
jgi:hypothetical protein